MVAYYRTTIAETDCYSLAGTSGSRVSLYFETDLPFVGVVAGVATNHKIDLCKNCCKFWSRSGYYTCSFMNVAAVIRLTTILWQFRSQLDYLPVQYRAAAYRHDVAVGARNPSRHCWVPRHKLYVRQEKGQLTVPKSVYTCTWKDIVTISPVLLS